MKIQGCVLAIFKDLFGTTVLEFFQQNHSYRLRPLPPPPQPKASFPIGGLKRYFKE